MARVFVQRSASVQHYIAFLLLVSVTSAVFFIIYLYTEHSLLPHGVVESHHIHTKHQHQKDLTLLQKIQLAAAVKTHAENVFASTNFSAGNSSFLEKLSANIKSYATEVTSVKAAISINKMEEDIMKVHATAPENPTVNYNVHIFYYPWYGNPQTDGKYIHWNHKSLPYWKKQKADKWPDGVHVPPDDIGANFYPALGPYSSADPETVSTHMAQIRSTGTGVVVMSWYPPDQADENGHPFDKLVPLILDAAHAHGLKVCIHIEPYKDRNAETLNHHVKYIIDSYGQHPGFYRTQVGERSLPVFYVYDSYQIEASVWAQALKPGGPLSLRGTQYDAVFIGLYLSPEDEHKLLNAGFDGFYTYFAADGFTKGSMRFNWKSIAHFASQHNLLFIPSIGPGYVDTRIRPWNGVNTRKRLQGLYFKQSFQAALDAGVKYISVTSFNEWHEGSQVEPAIPKQIKGFTYEDYRPGKPDFYLQLLKTFVERFSRQG